MGKHIRHTVTITITESWIIVWLPGDDPLSYPPTLGQDPTNREEPPDEALQTTLTLTEPAPPPTPLAAVGDLQFEGTANRSTSRRRSKRARVGRTKGSRSKQ